MALVDNSSYNPPFWLANKHLETIYPALFRKISIDIVPENVVISTPDDDFFELHYYDNKADKTVIISHGLEGSRDRPYMLGMARIFYKNGFNVIAWSYRGCNGKINNSIKSYHSGFTEDLVEVINYAGSAGAESIALVGFSLGGNLTLKYLGTPDIVVKTVKSAIVFSVPLDLHSGCRQISRPSNIIYSKRFLRTLKRKVKLKARHFPEIQTNHLSHIQDLMSFDDHYTAPMHGFKDALDYYTSCSALFVLDQIKVPALIVNALNDPFLPEILICH